MKNRSDRFFYFLIGILGGFIVGLLFLLNRMPKGIEQDFLSYWFGTSAARAHALMVLTYAVTSGIVAAYLIVGHKIEKRIERELEMMREANHDINEFISLMSHQMRTALTGVSWGVKILLQDDTQEFSEEQKGILETAYRNVRTCTMLIEDLLNFGKLGLGRLNMFLRQVRLEEFEKNVRGIIEKFVPLAKEKHIAFTFSVSLNHKDEIVVDMFRIGQVIENLLENALGYISEEGKISILVENDAQYLTIKIADTGIGIPEAEQIKIFSKFFRASNAKNKQTGGTGIGLYLCHQFVSAHHGEINFVSTEGVGTTFAVKLPMKPHTEVEQFFLKV